jgi:hypothetical protein
MALRTIAENTMLFMVAAGATFAQNAGEEIPAVRVRIGNGESVPTGIVGPPQVVSDPLWCPADWPIR